MTSTLARVVSRSPDDTRRIAATTSTLSRCGDVLVLKGDVGTGKTTFAKGFAQGLGVVATVTSPTFTLVRQYAASGAGGIETFLHADLYRLDRLHDVFDLGLDELIEDRAVALVEWGEVAEKAFASESLQISFAIAHRHTQRHVEGSFRVLEFSAHGASWDERVGDLAEALRPWSEAAREV